MGMMPATLRQASAAEALVPDERPAGIRMSILGATGSLLLTC